MDFDKDTTAAPAKQFRRTRDGRMIAGVCAGTGRYFDIDPNIVRLALAVFSLFGGSGLALYAIAWLLLPEEGAETSVGEEMFKKASANPGVQDTVQKAKDALAKATR
ncbi:PspC domain-containing protein [Actinomadura macrotermitis]|nr:PspC domain-containing protein [Actinomadura macrotermitis]